MHFHLDVCIRQGIGLQSYGQRDPLVEYKMAGYDMFNNMLQSVREDTVRLLMHIRIEQKVEREQVAKVTGTNKEETAWLPIGAGRFMASPHRGSHWRAHLKASPSRGGGSAKPRRRGCCKFAATSQSAFG